MKLPLLFKERMERLLGEEYGEFIASYEQERAQGLRLNLIKTGREHFLEHNPFHLKEIPWAEEGFYYEAGDRPGRHPWHEAGVYYIQEPSAMAVVTLLDPQPGDSVLDLCAAPGGKTSHIASGLQGSGFLLSNEIHPARAKILSQTVERMGAANVVVTNETAERLLQYFPEFFDRIVVDAPCSGEGMFRKDEDAASHWSPAHVSLCAARQQSILAKAAEMLKDGGRLVYSTCTFAPEENERTVEAFLSVFPQFEVEETRHFPGLAEGRPDWSVTGRKDLIHTVRIWPHKTNGEGHFIAVLKKKGRAGETCLSGQSETSEEGRRRLKKPDYLTGRSEAKVLLREYREFCDETLKDAGYWKEQRELILFGDQLYLLPGRMPSFAGLKVLRPGLHLGTRKKNRFEPSHSLALAIKESQALLYRRFSADSRETAAYLRGEAVSDRQGPAGEKEKEKKEKEKKDKEKKDKGKKDKDKDKEEKGWALVTADGYSLGWAKLSGGVLKNHYPKGLRR